MDPAGGHRPVEHVERRVLPPDLGAELRAARQRLGMGVREVGRRAGIDYSYVAALERGERAPSGAVARALVEVLRLHPGPEDDLLAVAEEVDAARRARAEAGGWEPRCRAPRQRPPRRTIY